MLVKDLIAILSGLDPEATVTVWNCFHDCEEKELYVCITSDKNVQIAACPDGEQVYPYA